MGIALGEVNDDWKLYIYLQHPSFVKSDKLTLRTNLGQKYLWDLTQWRRAGRGGKGQRLCRFVRCDYFEYYVYTEQC
jgi:hypothetical protein